MVVNSLQHDEQQINTIPSKPSYSFLVFIQFISKMGKGGNATPLLAFTKNAHNDDDATTLELERKEKMNIAPDFHWASGDSMEEPHVKR